MIEDMRIRGMGDKSRKSHIRAIKDFAGFLKRSPDTATAEDLRAYQLHMTNAGITPTTFNARRLSAGRDDKGVYQIQPAELFRVYTKIARA